VVLWQHRDARVAIRKEERGMTAYEQLRKRGQELLASGAVSTIEQGIDRASLEDPALFLKARREPPPVPAVTVRKVERAPNAAWEMIEAKAKELVSKGLAKTTAQAVDRVIQEQPQLLVAYNRLRQGGGR
jgi:hypothetical protein